MCLQIRSLGGRCRSLEETTPTDHIQGTGGSGTKRVVHKSVSSVHTTVGGSSQTAPASTRARVLCHLPQPTLSRDVAPPPTHTPTTSTIIEKFLQETDQLSQHSPLPEQATVCSDGGSKAHSTHPSLLTERFVPLQPVSGPNVEEDTPAKSRLYSGDIAGRADEGGGRGDEEEREGGSSDGGHQLEGMFSKTLDSIVDRHFQQLNSSLRTLISKDT